MECAGVPAQRGNMPKSLVTGGAGFIGSHLTRELVSMGHSVVVLDDLSGGARENVPSSVTFIEGSITDNALLDRLFKAQRFDYCYHLAAYAAEGLSHFIRRFNYTNNLIGSVNLINECVKNEVKRFVFTSSIAVYGAGELPLRESQTPHPEDPYGIAKLGVEFDLAAAQSMFGLDYTVFRPHNVYGEYQNLGDRYRNVIGIFMNQIMAGKALSIFGDGSQTRAFSYVGDIVPAIARCVNMDSTKGEVFNVGGDHVYSVKQLAEILVRITGSNSALNFLPARSEVQHAYSDHSKFQSIFGHERDTALAEGLEMMWSWAKSRGVTHTSRFGAIEVEKNLPTSWRD
jgi:UDP-glucose 4-epimerase